MNPRRLGWIVAGVCFGLGAACIAVASPKPSRPPVVAEFVDLSCPHCRAFAPAADQLAEEIRQQGGVFRVAPIGPLAKGSDNRPASSVLAVYYARGKGGDAAGQSVADALYEGYESQAMLTGRAGTVAWLSLMGVELPDDGKFDVWESRRDFRRAARIAENNGVKALPALLVYNPITARVDAVVSWKGSASNLLARVRAAIQKTRESVTQDLSPKKKN